ncbi:MAG: proteasome activator [Actinomycetota bacterium]
MDWDTMEEQEPTENEEATQDAETDPLAERPIDPTKLMRIASLVREVLEEARRMPATQEAATELAELYGRVKKQLEDALPEFLVEELDQMELDLPFRDGATADEVRVAYSGLIGWLGGLFQGLQASFQAQSAISQLEHSEAGEHPEKPFQGGVRHKKEGYL